MKGKKNNDFIKRNTERRNMNLNKRIMKMFI